MDGHIAEDTAGTLDIIDRRRARVATGNGYHLDLADRTVIDRRFNPDKIRVEAAIKTDHQSTLGLIDDF